MRTLSELKAVVDNAPRNSVIEMSREEMQLWQQYGRTAFFFFEPDRAERERKAVIAGLFPDDPATDPAAQLLDRAKEIVTGARRKAYGTPEDNFRVIAELWLTYLSRRCEAPMERDGEPLHLLKIDAADVATMMVLMKCARLAETPDHYDSWVDIAGYAACGTRASGAKP